MKHMYDNFSKKTSKLITNEYSTSFSFSARLLSKKIRPAIYSIYGLVRLADEIVDSFHEYDKKALLDQLKVDYNLFENSYLDRRKPNSTGHVHCLQHRLSCFIQALIKFCYGQSFFPQYRVRERVNVK